MTGLRKAAILLVRMGKEYSTRVLASMSESEVEELSGATSTQRMPSAHSLSSRSSNPSLST